MARPRTASTTWRSRIDSHQHISHDSIANLGHDWSRVADPDESPQYPAKVYLPRTAEDVAAAVIETRQLGQRLVVRSKGHSSNHLVTPHGPGTAVLLTQVMDQVLAIDADAGTATVQVGVANAALDDLLAERGLGLPVVGDHRDITVGGFLSVGGISPTSHRNGLFVERVVEVEFVDAEGVMQRCGPQDRPELYWQLAGGLGRGGIITQATLQVVPIDKYRTVLANDQTHYRSFEAYLAATTQKLRDPGDAWAARGMWLDLGRGRGLGQFSSYHATPASTGKALADKASHEVLHRIGLAAGTVPAGIDKALKLLGTAATMYAPPFASMKNVEFFSDKLIDSTVGDPTRMLIALVPLDVYPALVPQLWQLLTRYRQRHACFTFLACYVKGITSDYLARGGERQFSEVTFLLGIRRGALTETLLAALVEQFDTLVIAHDAYRYMHTRTVADDARRALIDPNLRHLARLATTP
ncbi:FAD-binding oxidoreductase [Propionibacteriaceae bacterium G1746]|uniref:FAD-binding oxidoreductase n=1 Tax=Aestuariimicrobium sp. G57 TaxID=3418485 RepID=UPI003C1361AF